MYNLQGQHYLPRDLKPRASLDLGLLLSLNSIIDDRVIVYTPFSFHKGALQGVGAIEATRMLILTKHLRS